MKFYNKNPRRITPKQLEQLKANIQELGDLSGIVHDLNTDEIISGNQRSKVIDINKCEVVITEKYDTPNQQGTVAWGFVIFEGQKLNYRQVRWDERQREKANITANALGGDWDYDILEDKFNREDLLNWGLENLEFKVEEENFETSEDNFTDEDANQVESRVKLGDIWQLGQHRLMCGDSTDSAMMRLLMDGHKADMVFTDPPYNCNYGNIKHSKFKVREIKNDNMDSEHFRMFCEAFCKQIKEYCRGCVYMCAGQGEDGRTMFVVADRMLHNSTTIIWNKDQFTLGRGKYQNKYEPIWFGWVESGKDFSDDRTLTNVWDIPRPKKSELHPTMKPIILIATALLHNPKSKSVLDLFGGSGSVLIACEQLNRKCYMMELEPHYCDIIIDRWEKFTGNKANLLQRKEDDMPMSQNEPK